MGTELSILDRREILGSAFSIYGTPDDPMFLARDVAGWIGHSQPSVMIGSVDDSEKGMKIVHTLGGPQEMWFLTEDGLYEVLMQSRLPAAKEFKTEVKKILRSIRRHGAYMTPARVEQVLSDPDTLIRLATELKNERARHAVVESQRAMLLSEMRRLGDLASAMLADDTVPPQPARPARPALMPPPMRRNQRRTPFELCQYCNGADVPIGGELTFPTNTHAVAKTLRAEGIVIGFRAIARWMIRQQWTIRNVDNKSIPRDIAIQNGWLTCRRTGTAAITELGFRFLLDHFRKSRKPQK